MAIAALEDIEWGSVPEGRGRPALTLVRWDDAPADLPAPERAVRLGTDVSERRSVRQSARVRRRRLALALIVAGLAAGLVLPVSVFGGRAADGASSLPGALAGGPGYVYVVQPGDTLHSIADRVDPANADRLAAQLASQTGSAAVVPGEHLTLP